MPPSAPLPSADGATLADAGQFGHDNKQTAAAHLDALLDRIAATFPQELELPPHLNALLRARLDAGLKLLRHNE